MKIFLLIGQSNMAGPGISRYTPEDDECLKGVYLLNGKDEWEEAKNPINGYSTVKINPNPGISPGVTFAEEIKKHFTSEKIGIVSNARGASKISQWQKGEWLFNEAVRRTKAACKEDSLAGILWLQGEQDVAEYEDYVTYAEKFETFIKDLRNELGNENIPFIACEIWGNAELALDEWKQGIKEVNQQIKEVIEKMDNCEWISSEGVEHTLEEPVHFAPEGMRVLGKRYAKKYIEKWSI